jgi:hypothetical protein
MGVGFKPVLNAIHNSSTSIRDLAIGFKPVNLFFFSSALKLFGFRFSNYIVVVWKMKSGMYLCNFSPVLCCVVPFMLITLICLLQVWIL